MITSQGFVIAMNFNQIHPCLRSNCSSDKSPGVFTKAPQTSPHKTSRTEFLGRYINKERGILG